MCVCACTSVEDGIAFGKWRVSARTCQKGPQSSGSVRQLRVQVSVYESVCAVNNRGSRKCPLKGPISNSTCKLGIEPLVRSGHAVKHPLSGCVRACLYVPCGVFLG